MSKKRVCAILLAGGSGSRMQMGVTKQKIKILGESVIHRAARALDSSEAVDAIVAVSRADELSFVRQELADIGKLIGVVAGGETRFESAKCGFDFCGGRFDFVAIHDAARCLATPQLIDRVVSAAILHGAASAVSSVTSTVKRIKDGKIVATESRDTLVEAETPQVFSSELYQRAIDNALKNALAVTDDNMLLEAIGEPVYTVVSEEENLKITTKKDIKYAEYLLSGEVASMPNLRVGHGYDVHRFREGRDLILGGVKIEHSVGLLGHSDADVLAHAVMDSVIGALGLGDIGRHFPDSDEKYRGISSITLLSRVGELLSERGARVVNIDATVVLQSPKIGRYIPEMANNISNALGCDSEAVNIKATTEEGLGFTGSGEGAAAHSVAMIELF